MAGLAGTIFGSVRGPDEASVRRTRPDSRTSDNLIVKLRRKLEEDQKSPRHILKVYGLGYKLGS